MLSQNYGDIVFLLQFLKNLRRVFLFPVLSLLSFVWLLLHNVRIICGRYEKMPVPVVCVGNITLGGAGKTPTVIYLAKHLRKNNIKVHVVSRGYGGKYKDTVLVDRKIHTASNVGDEPLLISKYANVWVSKKKREGILAAYKAGAEIVLLDDGHQNFSITKNMNILVLDTEVCLQDQRIFPLGNLRENPSSAISRADFLFCIGHKISRTKLRKTFNQLHSTKIVEGEFKANISPFFKKHKLVAFCGIGRPEKFFSMLRRLDLEIIEEYSYPDHHFYSNKELNKILGVAKDNNALVVTTEKDFVKLPSTFTKKIYSVDIELHLEKNESLLKDLKNLVS